MMPECVIREEAVQVGDVCQHDLKLSCLKKALIKVLILDKQEGSVACVHVYKQRISRGLERSFEACLVRNLMMPSCVY